MTSTNPRNSSAVIVFCVILTAHHVHGFGAADIRNALAAMKSLLVYPELKITIQRKMLTIQIVLEVRMRGRMDRW